jgi:uncharacterized protein (DUF433 family)
MVTSKKEINGIYRIPEAAIYLANTAPFISTKEIKLSRLHYWIRSSVPQLTPQAYPSRQRLITFLDLVSMRMVAVLRSRNVGLQEIRNTEKWLRDKFGLEYPLANKQLWTYGSDIFIKFEDMLLSTSKFGQQAMSFINNWLSKVELDMTFDQKNNADSWLLYNGIRIDPDIQVGEPCIDGTRIPISAIWSNYLAGDSFDLLANSYELTVTDIKNAIHWKESIVPTKTHSILLSR